MRSTPPRATRSRSRPGSSSTSHTMSDAIKYMIREGYEDDPGIQPRDVFCNNDSLIGDVHNADVQTIVPIHVDDRLVGWVAGVTHVIEIGASTPGSLPLGPISRFEDGIDIPARKIGANDRLFRDHVQAAARGTRLPKYWTLDERTRLAGCLLARRAGRGSDRRHRRRHLSAVLLGADRGRPAVVPVRRLHDDGARPLPGSGVLGDDARRRAADARPRSGRLAHARPGGAAGDARRQARARPRRGVGVGLPLGQLHHGGDAGRALGSADPDPARERQDQRRGLLRARHQLSAGELVKSPEPPSLDRRRRGASSSRASPGF